ncbi:MAG: HD domain-containing phosphohydrolase, partial [Chloroflexota bacterium]
MDANLEIRVIDLVFCLSQAVDMVDAHVADHHKRVAYIVFSLAEEMGLPEGECMDLALAGALHDIGGLALKDRLALLEFESISAREHGELGYQLVHPFRALASVADLIRSHHVYWENGAGASANGRAVPPGSHLLHLADRVAVQIDPHQEVLLQAETIRARIQNEAGRMFRPEQVQAFCRLSARESFWLDAISSGLEGLLGHRAHWRTVRLETEDMAELARLFCRTIDFRSPFTATHSSGVATVAELLAELDGFSLEDRQIMRIAGYLHDLGKLAVPTEILDKPARLTDQEFAVVRHHTYYTDRILQPVGPLDKIRTWGALHHERLDGSGYPFHLTAEQLPRGSRIMAVADVFVAVTEDRPYRRGMDKLDALEALRQKVDGGALDRELVALAKANYERVDQARR